MSRRKWLKEIYIAKKIGTIEDDYGHETVQYDKPKKYLMNVQPLSGSSDIEAYGSRIMQMQKGMCEYDKYFGKFSEDDVVYLDGATPDGETVYGEFGNYRIDAVLNQNKRIAIYFERLIKSGK